MKIRTSVTILEIDKNIYLNNQMEDGESYGTYYEYDDTNLPKKYKAAIKSLRNLVKKGIKPSVYDCVRIEGVDIQIVQIYYEVELKEIVINIVLENVDLVKQQL